MSCIQMEWEVKTVASSEYGAVLADRGQAVQEDGKKRGLQRVHSCS